MVRRPPGLTRTYSLFPYTTLCRSRARRTRDGDGAEELAQEALLAALTDWPASGVPDRPGAWLMAAAKRRAIDGFRRAAMQDRKQAEIAREMDEAHAMSIESVEAGLDDDLGDELLGLIFAACHPAISPEARAALTLRLDRKSTRLNSSH